MDKKKDPTWEQSSQVKEIMESNKPVKVKEYATFPKWEKCVKEYFEKDKREWEERKNK